MPKTTYVSIRHGGKGEAVLKTLDPEYVMRAGHIFGMIVLQADETIEQDMTRLLPDTVALLVSRVPSGTAVTPETLDAMRPELQQSASLFPRSVQMTSVGYGCTSGSAQIGTDDVTRLIKNGVDTTHVTNPITALCAATRALKVRNLGILSPYVQAVSEKLCHVIETAGLQVVDFASFNEEQEERVVRISPASIMAGALEIAASPDVEAIFISCTNLRTLDIIEEVEAKSGKPVLTSNQLLAWHMLTLAGLRHDIPYGQLWQA